MDGIARNRAVLTGTTDARLHKLLGRVLADAGIDLEAEPSGSPGIVLVMLEHFEDTVEAIVAARVVARGVPIVAVLPLSDARWARGALAAGAARTWALDASMEALVQNVIELLGTRVRRR